MKKKWIEVLVPKELGLPYANLRKTINGDIKAVIIMLQKVVDKLEASGYRNTKICWSHMEGVPCYDIWAERLEREHEFQKRIEAEQKEEQKERELYERLKKKFE